MADWYPVPTVVDTENNTLTAQVDHLSVWDFKASSWQGYSVPTVDTFQVSDFTGAGTYSQTLWTPSGPAGFQPDLTLSYNSQVIDEGSAYTQASWVGMGWSLDFGSITRNMHGTNSNTDDDTFNISAGGVSGLLLPVSVNGNVTTFNTADQSFLKVQKDDSTNVWTAWTKDGYIYTFNQQAKTNKTNGCVTSTNDLNMTWRWSLGTKTDKYGNTITYTYVNETKSSTCLNVVAVYPDKITYPNNRYRIEFVLGDRHDYQSSWTANNSTYLYSKKRLTEIRIKNNSTGDWNAATTVRKYDFSYATDGATSNVIYPKLTWTGGTNARTSTLISVREYSGDGSSSLPATTFTYDDSMHLTKVNNGQGGQVQMTYERWAYFDDINDSTRSLYTAFGELHQECDPIDGLGTAWVGVVNYSYVRCDGSIHYLQVGQDPNMSIGHRPIPENVIKPGSQYRFAIYVRALQGTTDTNWGFIDTSTNQVRMLYSDDWVGSIGSTITSFDATLDMPVDFSPNTTLLRLECDDCLVQKLQFSHFPTYYRVITRTETDAITGKSYSYSYKYDNAAPNVAANSEAVAASNENYSTLYNYPMTEYRGNSMTQVVDSNNLATIKWFYQNDALKGQVYRTVQMHEDLYSDFEFERDGDGNPPPVSSYPNWQVYGGTTTTFDGIYMTDFDGAIKIDRHIDGLVGWFPAVEQFIIRR